MKERSETNLRFFALDVKEVRLNSLVGWDGEPVGDAGALLGHLLENSGASVPDDVVVALHGAA